SSSWSGGRAWPLSRPIRWTGLSRGHHGVDRRAAPGRGAPDVVHGDRHQCQREYLLLNTKRPPFDNVKVRRALSLAIDRRAYVKAVHSGSALVGAAMAPKPWGAWGLPEKDTQQLPGYGKGEEGKVRARKLLAEAGYG